MVRNRPQITYSSEVRGKAKRLLVKSLEFLTGRRRLEKAYSRALESVDNDSELWGAALNELQIGLDYNPERLKSVPAEGPLIFIANHPYGVLDGLAICHLASLTRRNFRIMINAALCMENRLASYMLPIDFRSNEESIKTNIESMRSAIETLRDNGALIIFPAGGIATAVSPFGRATDLDWKLSTAKLIHQSKATVVPVFFHGQNSRLFQLVSLFSLTLRLSLIIHEVNKKISESIRISIGEPIPYEKLAVMKSRQELTSYLRQVTYGVGGVADLGSASLEWKQNLRRLMRPKHRGRY